ncbi:Protein Wnt-8b [Homalodisca vitripennis]|nr:Protein Wnt-8b [Homalodisca vitripennis]
MMSSSINSLLQSRSLLPDSEQQPEGRSLFHSLTAGAQLALEQCQEEFQWDRWNCPDSVFSRRGRQLLTKETALVSALTAAGIIFSITRNCSRGQLPSCGCQNSTRTGEVYGNNAFTVNCLNNLEYAEKVAAEFLESLENESKDPTATINLHNYIVGKEAIRQSLHTECKCHGLSTLCKNKVCTMKIGSFQDISDGLRRSYEKARLVDWNSVVMDPEILVPKQLLYLSESPDYCQPNITTGWPGTLGRACSRARGPDVSSQERNSCRRICRSCGHTVRRSQRTLTYRCKCSFNWCCSVTCEECTRVVQQYYCD